MVIKALSLHIPILELLQNTNDVINHLNTNVMILI